MFVDIRGFTTMSEKLPPEQVVEILNSYFELTTNAIFDNGGTLDKFIGDATMAVFNAPFDLDDYVFRAVKTALDIVAGGDAIESKFLEKYGRSVGFGVGASVGFGVGASVGFGGSGSLGGSGLGASAGFDSVAAGASSSAMTGMAPQTPIIRIAAASIAASSFLNLI